MNRSLHHKFAWVFKHTVLLVSFMSPLMPASVLAGANQNESDGVGWYVAASARRIISAEGDGPEVDLGSSVRINGTTDYQSSNLLSVSTGKEFTAWNEGGNPRHLRLELQYLDGSVKRGEVHVGQENPSLGDRVKLRALFVNTMLRLTSGGSSHLWLGGGVGLGRSEFPSAEGSTSCGCLKPSESDGLAWQVMLQAEQKVYRNSSLFAEVGYHQFPGSKASGTPSVEYGRLGLVTVGLGVRTLF